MDIRYRGTAASAGSAIPGQEPTTFGEQPDVVKKTTTTTISSTAPAPETTTTSTTATTTTSAPSQSQPSRPIAEALLKRPLVESPGKYLLAGLSQGFIFGFVAEKSKVFLPTVIRSSLKLESFIVIKVFLAAVLSGLAVFTLMEHYNIRNRPTKISYHRAAMFGGLLFGAGMAIAGSCPGQVYVQMGASMFQVAVPVFIGCVIGALLYSFFHASLSSYVRQWSSTVHTLDQALGMPLWKVALGFGGFIFTLLNLIEFLYPWTNESQIRPVLESLQSVGKTGDASLLTVSQGHFLPWLSDAMWSPIFCGSIIGLLQLPTLLLVDHYIGASSSFATIGGLLVNLFYPRRYMERSRRTTYLVPFLRGRKHWWQLAMMLGLVIGASTSTFMSGVSYGLPYHSKFSSSGVPSATETIKAVASELKDKVPSLQDIKDKVPSLHDIKDKVPSLHDIKEMAPNLQSIREMTPSVQDIKNMAPDINKIKDMAPDMNTLREVASEVQGAAAAAGDWALKMGQKVEDQIEGLASSASSVLSSAAESVLPHHAARDQTPNPYDTSVPSTSSPNLIPSMEVPTKSYDRVTTEEVHIEAKVEPSTNQREQQIKETHNKRTSTQSTPAPTTAMPASSTSKIPDIHISPDNLAKEAISFTQWLLQNSWSLGRWIMLSPWAIGRWLMMAPWTFTKWAWSLPGSFFGSLQPAYRAFLVLQGIIGGALMLFGARMADGCTSGHGISGLGMLQIASFVMVPALFVGGMLTSWLLY